MKGGEEVETLNEELLLTLKTAAGECSMPEKKEDKLKVRTGKLMTHKQASATLQFCLYHTDNINLEGIKNADLIGSH